MPIQNRAVLFKTPRRQSAMVLWVAARPPGASRAICSFEVAQVAQGEPAVYLHTQRHAFASGARSNRISGQMRNVARGMTTEELDVASRFNARQP